MSTMMFWIEQGKAVPQSNVQVVLLILNFLQVFCTNEILIACRDVDAFPDLGDPIVRIAPVGSTIHDEVTLMLMIQKKFDLDSLML